MPETVIDYALRVMDQRNGLDPDVIEGRRQAREAVLAVLAEVDLEPDQRRRVLQALRDRGVL